MSNFLASDNGFAKNENMHIMRLIRAFRSKEVAWAFESALIQIFKLRTFPNMSRLVNAESNDMGGNGRPRDDSVWYFVYIVRITDHTSVKWGRARR